MWGWQSPARGGTFFRRGVLPPDGHWDWTGQDGGTGLHALDHVTLESGVTLMCKLLADLAALSSCPECFLLPKALNLSEWCWLQKSLLTCACAAAPH